MELILNEGKLKFVIFTVFMIGPVGGRIQT